MIGLVENLVWSFGQTISLFLNKVVKVIRDRKSRDFGDNLWGDPETGHQNEPVFELEFSALFLEVFFELNFLLIIGVFEPLIL